MSLTLPGIVVNAMQNRSAYSALCVREVLDTITDPLDRNKLEIAIEWLDTIARIGEEN